MNQLPVIRRDIPRVPHAVWSGLLLALLMAGCSADKSPDPRKGAVPVTTQVVQQVSAPLTIDTQGSVLAINHVDIRSRVDGQITSVDFGEGNEVRAGQILFRLDARPYQALLAQAKAALARDQATLERAHAQRQRYDDLRNKDYVSQDDYAQIKANEQTAAAAVQADQAAIEAAQLNVDYCVIRAPVAGRTGAVALRTGNLVRANENTVLVSITRMDQVYVELAVPQRWLGELRQNLQSGTAMMSVASNGDNYQHATRVSFIDNTIDTANGTVRVRATVDNAARDLWPGQFVHTRLQLAAAAALAVPLGALGTGPEGNYVYVVNAEQRVRQQAITFSRQTDQLAVVQSGLKEGEVVVTDGQSRLHDGDLISVTAAAQP